MKKIFISCFILLTISTKSQVNINYYNWRSNHLLDEPQKFNRCDSWIYIQRYYYSPTISFTLKPFRYKPPFNYFLYKEKKRKYKFIF